MKPWIPLLDGRWHPDDYPVANRCLRCGRQYPCWDYGVFDPGHELYAEVKPCRSIEEFDGHPVCRAFDLWEEPAPAKFGYQPSVTAFRLVHGVGQDGMPAARLYSVETFLGDSYSDNESVESLWQEAGNMTRWRQP